MSVSIEDIKSLREKTGVSMMICKKALEEASGDVGKAIELLRKKGEAKAEGRSGKATGNGVVSTKVKDGKVAMVKLLCETDFVSIGDEFSALAMSLVDKLLKGEISVDDRDLPEIKDAILKLGENIQIGEMFLKEGSNIGTYVHSNKRIGVVLLLKGGSLELSKDLAMHIAATNPQVISPDEIDQALVDKEKEIWVEQLKNEGKPEAIFDKIMIGKEKKFREENALLKQSFVKNPEKTVEQLLAEVGSVVEDFVRFEV